MALNDSSNANKFSDNILIKFSEKELVNIIDVNELCKTNNETLPYEDIVKYELVFATVSDKDIMTFLYNSGLRVNSNKVILKGDGENLSFIPSYVYTEGLNVDAIFTITLDKFSSEDYLLEHAPILCGIFIYYKDGTSKYYIISLYFISDILKSVNIYPSLATPIGDKLESFMLLRTNPKLTGNIKLVVDSNYNLYLDTIKVSSASILNERDYRHQMVSADGNFAHDIKTVFGKLPKGVLFDVHTESYEPHRNYYDMIQQVENTYEYGAETNNDSLYPENMKIFAPLYIGKHLPDYFCIFKSDNIINLETYSSMSYNDIDKFKEILSSSTAVKIIDLRKHTTIGLYLYNYMDQINEYLAGSCYLLFIEQEYSDKNDKNYLKYHRQGVNTWKGISVDKGILVSKLETTYFSSKILEHSDGAQEKFNMFLLKGFSRNNILFPNIINLEYMFNDELEDTFTMKNYFGLYLTENQFLTFNLITLDKSEINADIKYYTKDQEILNKVAIENYLSVIESKEYVDRIFFMSTNDTVANVYNINDVNTFIKQNVCNMPDKNICNVDASILTFDKCDAFITMQFTEQIKYGEHFKFIILDYINESSTEHIVLEVIASNDIRLAYTKDNINPYISTNTIKPISYPYNGNIKIYRMTFYTQDVTNELVPAPLDEQLKRLKAAINKFSEFIYVQHVSNNAISVMAYNEQGNIALSDDSRQTLYDVYFLHILSDARDVDDSYTNTDTKNDYIRYYSFNNIAKCHVLLYDTDLYSSDALCFANNGLELTGNRYYCIIPFLNVSDYDKYKFYQIDSDIHEKIKDVTYPLINTVRGYYPLGAFSLKNMYINLSGAFNSITDRNVTNLVVDADTPLYDIISPFNTSSTLVLSIYNAHLSARLINICTPKSASLSLMGINSVKDLDTYIGVSSSTHFNKSTTANIKKGEKLYFDNSDMRLLLFVVYLLVSGNIRNLPIGKNIRFMIIPGKILYTYNDDIKYIPIINNYIIADEDTVLMTYNNLSLDDYDYTISEPTIDITKYFNCPYNRDLSDLNIPIVPLINCKWQSNGIYFDHDSILNVRNFNTDYQKNVNANGHFIQNIYTLSNENNNQYITSSVKTPIKDINGIIKSFLEFILLSGEDSYSYPLKKFIILNYHPDTAIGYYNKYVQTLEFIFYGIKFIIKFTDTDYSNEIKLDLYNNYQVFILNDYNGSDTNDIYISTKEEFMLIINHAYLNKTKFFNTNIAVLRDHDIYTSTYNWEESVYNLDFLNTCMLSDNLYGFNKSDNYKINTADSYIKDVVYFIESDLDIYDNELSVSDTAELPFYAYLKIDEQFGSYDTYDILNYQYNSNSGMTSGAFMVNNPEQITEDKKYNTTKLLNSAYTDSTSGCNYTYKDEQVNSLTEFFKESNINYRSKHAYLLKILSDTEQILTDNILKAYKDTFNSKNFNVYIIKENTVSTINISKNYSPIVIDKSIPVNIKYNNGFFNPVFKDIFEFLLNDNIADAINMDCLLANTCITNIKALPNYTYNKVMNNSSTCLYNYYIVESRSVLSTNWDYNIYRLYSSDTAFSQMAGYTLGINDKTFFGSKCLVINDNVVTLTNWSYDKSNVAERYIMSDYNDNTTGSTVCQLCINITKCFADKFINTDAFVDNWNNVINNDTDKATAINNYINNIIKPMYNFGNAILQVFRKFDVNKTNSKCTFVYNMPEDIDMYEEVINVKTEFKTINNEIILNITLSDYTQYYYYPIIKIYKY